MGSTATRHSRAQRRSSCRVQTADPLLLWQRSSDPQCQRQSASLFHLHAPRIGHSHRALNTHAKMQFTPHTPPIAKLHHVLTCNSKQQQQLLLLFAVAGFCVDNHPCLEKLAEAATTLFTPASCTHIRQLFVWVCGRAVLTRVD